MDSYIMIWVIDSSLLYGSWGELYSIHRARDESSC